MNDDLIDGALIKPNEQWKYEHVKGTLFRKIYDLPEDPEFVEFKKRIPDVFKLFNIDNIEEEAAYRFRMHNMGYYLYDTQWTPGGLFTNGKVIMHFKRKE